MENLKRNFLQKIPDYDILSVEDLNLAQDYFELNMHSKDEMLLREGQICKHLYFNCQGLVHSYLNDEQRQIIWFEFENSFFTDVNSFFKRVPSSSNIQVLEDETILLSISFDMLRNLYKNYHSWALWGTKTQQEEFVKLTSLYEDLRIKDASERYLRLVDSHPQVLQRVSLGSIASYLRISQVSLSRIRAGRQKKQTF